MGGIKAHAINTMLERMGLQEKKEKEWRLTEEGKDFGEEIPYTKNGHSNYMA